MIATHGRPRLLSERALSSVTDQTRSPDFLVVVDDSSADLRTTNRGIVEALSIPGCRVAYLENARSKGASGSWNTALDFLLAEVAAPARTFVAILDDDDAWHAPYLERCEGATRSNALDMVAADLRRIEAQHRSIEEAPEALRAADFLVSNPGIQGSNLFARLTVILAAGAFDEALRSTTDRDLGIRIADLGWVKYARLPAALVDHFADPDRARLSTRGSEAKLDGLSVFWRKYAGRMRSDQREAFSKRAAALFDWRPPSEPAFPDGLASDARPHSLVLGLVASHTRPAELLATVKMLATCGDEVLLNGLDIVLFEHGARSDEDSDIVDLAATSLRNAGLGCFCFTLECQEEVDSSLAACCAAIAQARLGSDVWLATTCPSIDEHRDDGIAGILRRLDAKRCSGEVPTGAANSADNTQVLERWVMQERARTAEYRVRQRYSLNQLRVLGWGSESVVFTDDHTVYKCIDYWKSRMSRSRLDFLHKQVGRWTNMPGLYALREVLSDGPYALLSYDFEESAPYQGGLEQEMVALLLGCNMAGIVCNNVHPKNLIVTASGVKLIDYGSDIRPWSRLGFEHMARRTFLSCHHATHPDLRGLMRRALTNIETPEFAGYAAFRARLCDPTPVTRSGTTEALRRAPAHPPLSLYVGVITSDPPMLRPLLCSLETLARASGIGRLVAVVLDNASPAGALESVIREKRHSALEVALVSVAQQRHDASEGAFGSTLRQRPVAQVGIAVARTMLQRYLGVLLEQDPESFGWLLDDDMRVDDRARHYLSWLPAFRAQGVDVLLGAYEGSSPNPPLNGLRGQLVDIFHNLTWLRGLPGGAPLPDRSAENAVSRARFPDYYYDLSRKHTAHLEMPHWVEAMADGETVAEAYARLLAEAPGILSGAPLTRPIISTMPPDPIAAARDSVNRGGCTFVLNYRALTQTPNTITHVHDREARRSDMIWAISNRYYRRMTIKAVAFPVLHVGRVTGTPHLNVEKVVGEIVGSALYAGLSEFLSVRPSHELNFSTAETEELRRLSGHHQERRLQRLHQSFFRIAGLRDSIREAAQNGELDDLCIHLDEWFVPAVFEQISSTVREHGSHDVEVFFASLCAVADDYASATVSTAFIQAQLGPGLVHE